MNLKERLTSKERAHQEEIKGIILEEIENLRIGTLDLFAKQNLDILRQAYDDEIVTDDDLEGALRVSVFNQSKDYWNLLKAGKKRINELEMPEILVYGLNEAYIGGNVRDEKRIETENKINLESFCKQNQDVYLITRLKYRLLNPRATPEVQGDDLKHPVCLEC